MEKENRRILVVDDSEEIHALFKSILRKEVRRTSATTSLDDLKRQLFNEPNSKPPPPSSTPIKYEVDFASQGQAAYSMAQQAQTEQRPYALIFMDMRMPPGWDGLETTEKIWSVLPDTEIVICTAFSDYSWKEIVARVGGDDHLTVLKKPFEVARVHQLALDLTTKWNVQHGLAH